MNILGAWCLQVLTGPEVTFSLKDRLREEGLSTRGYVRDNLERRLYNKLTRR